MAIERTLVILKPDAMARNLGGTIIRNYLEPLRARHVAYDLIGEASQDLVNKVEQHYAKDDAWCLKWGTKKRELLLKDGDSKTTGALLTALDLGYDIRAQLYASMAAVPLHVQVLEGENIVQRVRAIIGATDPAAALPGTVRADLCEVHEMEGKEIRESISYAQTQNRAVRNLVHASDSVSEAEREIKIWFPDLP